MAARARRGRTTADPRPARITQESSRDLVSTYALNEETGTLQRCYGFSHSRQQDDATFRTFVTECWVLCSSATGSPTALSPSCIHHLRCAPPALFCRGRWRAAASDCRSHPGGSRTLYGSRPASCRDYGSCTWRHRALVELVGAGLHNDTIAANEADRDCQKHRIQCLIRGLRCFSLKPSSS